MVLALAAWGAMPAFVGARRWRWGPRADAPDDRLIVGQFCNGLHQFLFIFRVHIGCLLIQNDDGRSFMMARAMDMVKDSVLNGIWLNVAETAITG